MKKQPVLVLLLTLTSFLIACAGSAVAQQNEATPTIAPETSEPTTIPLVSSNDCPATVPQIPAFTPPAPYNSLASFNGHFWFGSSALWTVLPQTGVWEYLPHNPNGYSQKILWWRDGYVWNEEPEPNLFVTGERLDVEADAEMPPLIASKATNAFASDIGSAMLVGVDFPTLGCWKITGRYNNAELSFVIWVQE